MPEEAAVKCPECSSALITEVSNMKRCQQCGHQFGLVKDPIAQRAQAARADARGWPPNPART